MRPTRLSYMALPMILSLLALSGASGPAQAAGLRTPNDSKHNYGISTACQAQVAIIGARGSGESDTSGGAGYEGFGTRAAPYATAIAAGLPTRVSYRTIGVPYTAISVEDALSEATSLWKAGKDPSVPYKSSVSGGVKLTRTIIEALVDKCPGTQIILLGYSQGAQVMHSVLASYELKSKYQKAINSAILIADPTHDASGLGYISGPKFDTTGASMRFVGLLGSGTSLDGTAGAKTVTICSKDDTVCNRGNLIRKITDIKAWKDYKNSVLNKVHSTYYQQPAIVAFPAKFIDAKLHSLAAVRPYAPRSVSLASSSGSFTVQWKAPVKKLGPAVSGYHLEFSADGKTWTFLTTTSAATRSFKTSKGIKGKSYRFRVAALNAVGRSGFAVTGAVKKK